MKTLPCAFALTLLGCSVSLGDPPADAASAAIGSEGGTVALANGPVMRIPAGALPASVRVSIVQSAAAPPREAFSKVYQFSPESITFAHPAEVSFPVPPDAAQAVVYWTRPGSATEFDMLPARTGNGSATAWVTHL